MPLIEEGVIQGALWDPDAGLVIPRSQVVSGEMIRDAEETGKLVTMANTHLRPASTSKTGASRGSRPNAAISRLRTSSSALGFGVA